MHIHSHLIGSLALATSLLISGLSVDVNDDGSLKNVAQTIAGYLDKKYSGERPGKPVGIYDQAYYWWESGAVWSGLIDYQAYTSDDQYQGRVQQALLAQRGPRDDFMPPNQTRQEGNMDQAMWALAAINAAEKGFPTVSGSSTWIDLAKNVFDLQTARWDNLTCDGGLRWQIFTFNVGYGYKDTGSQASFFLLAARLAQYTKNETYARWAQEAWDWTSKTGLISDDFKVYDGTRVDSQCSEINRVQWSYNAAALTYGSAVMYNMTNGDPKWKGRVESLAKAMSVFWSLKDSGILTEVACEPRKNCNDDQYTFKGLAAQWMGQTAQLFSGTNKTLFGDVLRSSATGAAKQCSGNPESPTCGFQWTLDRWDGTSGVGQDLSALNIFVANLAMKRTPAKLSESDPPPNGTISLGTSPTASQPPPTQSSSAARPLQLPQMLGVTAVLAMAFGL